MEACGSLAPTRLGGTLVGVTGDHGQLEAACFVGATVLPVAGTERAWTALGSYLGIAGRTCTAVTGEADAVAALWPALQPRWGRARLVRPAQPLLAIEQPAAVRADPEVRPAEPREMGRYLPAATSMLAEELQLDPLAGPARSAYLARLSDLIRARRALVRVDSDGSVIFKAELAAVSAASCQVQGVWVRPDLRGRGIGTAAMASVIECGLRLAPAVSLYVNDFNRAARTVYERLGMRQVGTLATVLY